MADGRRRTGRRAGEKHFIFYNPPVVNRELGIRRSAIKETRRDRRALPRHRRADDRLRAQPHARRAAAHLPGEGGAQGGHQGAARCAATAAATCRASGATSSAACATARVRAVVSHQRAGAGHRHRPARRVHHGRLRRDGGQHLAAGRAAPAAGTNVSAVVLVAIEHARPTSTSSNNPDFFLGRSRPSTRPSIRTTWSSCMSHLKCAAFELPFADGRANSAASGSTEILDYLADQRVLHRGRGPLPLDGRHLSRPRT